MSISPINIYDIPENQPIKWTIIIIRLEMPMPVSSECYSVYASSRKETKIQ